MTASWKQAESYGTLTHGPFLDPLTMFDDVFRDMPPNLQHEREEMRALLDAQRAASAAAPVADGDEKPPVAHEG